MSETNISTDGTSQFIAHKKKKRLRLLTTLSAKQTMTYGLIGAVLFFSLWEVAHLMTAEEAKKFLPSPFSVVQALIELIQEKNFMADVNISAYRIFGRFSIASLIAIPLGLLMGCFAPIRGLLNPVISGARYLPAKYFVLGLKLSTGGSKTRHKEMPLSRKVWTGLRLMCVLPKPARSC